MKTLEKTLLFCFFFLCIPFMALGKNPDALSLSILLPNYKRDSMWSESMANSLDKLSPNYKLIYQENIAEEDFAYALKQTKNSQIVIIHMLADHKSILQQAKNFPKTCFLMLSHKRHPLPLAPNILSYHPDVREIAFLHGSLASAYANQSKVALLTALSDPLSILYGRYFERAFRSRVSSQKILKASVESPWDLVGSRHAAALLSLEYPISLASAFFSHSLGALDVFSPRETLWLGIGSSLEKKFPDTLLATQIILWKPVIEQVISLTHKEELEGQHFLLNYKNGGIEHHFNKTKKIPAHLREMAREIIKDFEEKKIGS